MLDSWLILYIIVSIFFYSNNLKLFAFKQILNLIYFPEKSNTQKVYQCERYRGTVQWFSLILQIYSDVSDSQMIKLIFLKTPKLR